jgi:hypothetical protein
MKGLEGRAAAFYLEPKVAGRSNLGDGREGKLEQRVSRKIDTEGNMRGELWWRRRTLVTRKTTQRHTQMLITMKS